MAHDWYALIGGSIRGPLDSRVLKSLADKGRLKRADQVRRGEDGKWVAARQVTGLFNEDLPNEDASAGAPDPWTNEMPAQNTSPEFRGGQRGLSLRAATMIAITTIVIALFLHVATYVHYVYQVDLELFSDSQNWWLLLNILPLPLGFGGILYFLFILRAKQSR